VSPLGATLQIFEREDTLPAGLQEWPLPALEEMGQDLARSRRRIQGLAQQEPEHELHLSLGTLPFGELALVLLTIAGFGGCGVGGSVAMADLLSCRHHSANGCPGESGPVYTSLTPFQANLSIGETVLQVHTNPNSKGEGCSDKALAGMPNIGQSQIPRPVR